MTKPIPETRDRFAYFKTIPTRWSDNDAYRHVNNAVYFAWFDTLISDYMLSAGVLDNDAGPICIVVQTGCSYFTPVCYPDVVHCGLRLADLGTTSVRYDVGIFRNEDAVASAQGAFVQVCCELATQRPVPFPDKMRAALLRLRLPGADGPATTRA
jgi:acyl-CoA thioester hydrolase